MEKTFRLQKTLSVIFIIVVVAMGIYILWFMTDFKDLFGLELKMNKPVAEFHDGPLQSFNTQFFYYSLVMICSILLIMFLELSKKVPDLFALVVMDAVLLAGAGYALYSFVQLEALHNVYASLDFSKVAMEGAVEYLYNDRAFIIGKVMCVIDSCVFIAYAGTLAFSHILYMKLRGVK